MLQDKKILVAMIFNYFYDAAIVGKTPERTYQKINS